MNGFPHKMRKSLLVVKLVVASLLSRKGLLSSNVTIAVLQFKGDAREIKGT